MKGSLFRSYWTICLLCSLYSPCLYAQTGDEPNFSIPDYAQEPGVRPDREYKIGPDGTEFVDFYNGLLRLNYVDLVVPGNGGLDIQIMRNYQSPQNAPGVLGVSLLGERTTTGVGWQIHFGRVLTVGGAFQACNIFDDAFSDKNAVLELPDGTRQVLYNSLLGESYDLVTKERWIAHCEADGFIVKSPQGLVYTMDFLHSIGSTSGTVARHYYVTRIEDRNGNSIDIEYADTGTHQNIIIQRVTSSDGRLVEFTYNNPQDAHALLTEIRANGQVWRYEYAELPNQLVEYYFFLKEVNGPEGMIWRYDYYGETGNGTGDPEAGFAMSRVTAPYGGMSEFTYQRIDIGAFPEINIDTIAVHTRSLSGPGIVAGTWTYDFQPGAAASNLDRTSVSTPIGREVHVHCGMQAIVLGTSHCGNLEGTLIRKEIYADGASSPSQTEEYQWHTPRISNQKDKRPTRAYYATSTGSRVLSQKTITRDGENYTTAYYNFDEFDNPGLIVEYTGEPVNYSTPDLLPPANNDPLAGRVRRDTVLTYNINIDKWLIRQVKNEQVPDLMTHSGIEREMDENGNLVSLKQYGDETRYSYFADGSLRAVIDPLGRVTQFSDYYRGVPRTEIHPLKMEESCLPSLNPLNFESCVEESFTVSRTVNGDGTVASETNARGFVTGYAYDGLNRLSEIETPRLDDQDISIGRSFGGGPGVLCIPACRSRTLTRGGFVERRSFDGFGRLLNIDADGIVKTFEYDALGRRVFESNPNNNNGTRFELDVLGRITRVIHTADNASIIHDYSLGGNRARVTDENNNSTIYFYRSFGNPDEREVVKIESPESVVTELVRYQRGDIRRITQGHADGSITHERYFIMEETNGRFYPDFFWHPETGYNHLLFDAAGNRIQSSVEDSPVTNYVYDAQNRLRTIQFPEEFLYSAESPDVFYDYDANGNVTGVVKGNTAWSYQYDENDNLILETLSVDDSSYIIRYEYNALDALESIVYPDGLRVEYSPDNKGWPTRVGSFASNLTFHPTGQLGSIQYSNGITTTMGLNSRLFPESIQAGNVVDLIYTYDNAGNIESIDDSVDPLGDIVMTYDGLNRLIGVNGNWGNGTIEYNAIGNIKRKTIGQFDLTYNYDLDGAGVLLTSVAGSRQVSYAYDTYGNASPVTSINLRLNRYDHASNLVDTPSGLVFEYDGNNRLTRKLRSQSSGTEVESHTIYNKAGQLLHEVDYFRCRVINYIRLGSQLIARSDGPFNQDSDSDGISDCDERLAGLDPEDPLDADMDADGDGLSNREEIQAGTGINNGDSDDDQIPDGYEVDNGLNPLENDAGADNDGDGVSNLAEYQAGSDPNDPGSVPVVEPGSVLWSATLNSGFVEAPAIGADGTIYIGRNYPARGIAAYNPDGTLRWTHNSLNEVGSPPAIGIDGEVYFVSRRFNSIDELVSVNQEGIRRWSYNFGNVNPTSPVVAPDGTVYVGTTGSQLFAFNSADGSIRWIYQAPVDIIASPAIGADGTVYLVAGTQLIVLSPDGDLLWSYSPENSQTVGVHQPVLGENGTVYIVNNIVSGNYQILALTSNGQLFWTYEFSSFPDPMAIGYNGIIYFGDSSGLLRALNPNGTLNRTYELGVIGTSGRLFGAPTIGRDGSIYVGVHSSSAAANRAFIAFNEDGSLRWRYELNSTGFGIRSSAAIAPDGTIYTPVAGGTQLLAFSSDSGGLAPTAWPMLGQNPARTGLAPVCDAQDGDADGIPDCIEIRQRLNPDDSADALLDMDGDGLSNVQEYQLGTFIALADSDNDYIPDGYESLNPGMSPLQKDGSADADGDEATNLEEYLGGTDPNDPTSALAVPPSRVLWSVAAPTFFSNMPSVADDGTFYVASQGTLIALNPDGILKWQYAAGGSTKDTAVAADGTVYMGRYVSSANINLVAVNPDGTLRWTSGNLAGELSAPPAIGEDGTIYASAGGRLYALNPDGQFIWSLPLNDGSQTTRPAIGTNGNIYLVSYSSGTLYSINPGGTVVWTLDVGLQGNIYSTPAVGEDGTIFLAQREPTPSVMAIDPGGVVKWQASFANSQLGASGPVVIGSGGVLYVTGNRNDLYALNPADGSLLWRSYLVGGGYIRSTIIGNDGIIYIAQGSQTSGTVTHELIHAFGQDGTLRWVKQIPGDGITYPTMGPDGVIYVCNATSDTVVAIQSGASGIADAPWPMLGHDARQTGRAGVTSTNLSPAVTIISPPDSQSVTAGETLEFSATASDPEDGDISAGIQWSSTIDGDLGTGGTVSSVLTAGIHTITASATDSGSLTSSNSITITVNAANAAPVVTIVSPENGTEFMQGDFMTFSATAVDAEDGDLGDQIIWFSDIDGILTVGAAITESLSLGMHEITASITDSGGETATDVITITVNPPPDTDNDGVQDSLDQCPNTPAGETVNANGCSASQLDADNDGVSDAVDQCPTTPAGEAVDENGCSASQRDSDNDGVSDAVDQCPNTPAGEIVNAGGCSSSQLDADNDGVSDALDQCPDTPAGETANAGGCSASQLDTDNDGVSDALDQCPNTPVGETVNANGCSASQLDADNDGVSDAVDQCPNTPTGEVVDANGCSASQRDADNDGVSDALDQCPATPAGEAVDANGCSASQLDTDNDGVSDALDECPNTPAGEAVDASGCSISQQPEPASAVTLNIDLASPQVVGTAVVFTAEASGGSGSYEYQFRIRGPATNDVWQVVQDYSSAQSFNWNTQGWEGVNRIQVRARNAGTSQTPVARGRNYSVLGVDSATEVSLSSEPGSPQTVGTMVVLTAQASGGSGNYEYQFQFRGPSSDDQWTVLREYGPDNTLSWNTTGRLGRNRLRVYARNAGTEDAPVVDSRTFWVNDVDAVTDVVLNANQESPTIAGVIVTFTAQASGGSGNYEYQFRVRGPATHDQWAVLQDFSADNTIDWDTTTYLGSNRIQVRARNGGSGDLAVREAERIWINQSMPATEVSLSASADSPQIAGTAVTLSAQAMGGSGNYEYEFRIRGPASNDAWVVLRDFASNNNLIWDTQQWLGQNRLQVRARNAGTADQPAGTGLTFIVNGPQPATDVNLSVSPPPPRLSGTVVVISAGASGGNGEYEYRFEIRAPATGDQWQVLQDYSIQADVNWNTAGYAGQNRVRVRARNAGTLDAPVTAARNYVVE